MARGDTKKKLVEQTQEELTAQNELSIEYVGAAEGAPLIHAAIINAMADVDAIVKTKQGTVSYKFRSIDDVMNAMHPILVKHRIFVVPFIETIDNRMYEQDKFGTGQQQNVVIGKRNLFQTILTCNYRFYTIDGSYIEAKVAAESSDYSDKATQQALSYCFKIAMLQTFCIPTQDTTDGDEKLTEVSGRRTPPAQPAGSRISNLPSISDRPPVAEIGLRQPQMPPPDVQAPPPQASPTNVVQMPPQEAASPEITRDTELPNEAAISFLELTTPAAWETLKNVLIGFSLTEKAFENWVKATLISSSIEVPTPSIYWLEKKHGRYLYEVAQASARSGTLLHAKPEGFQL